MYDVLPYTREFFCYRLLLEDGFNVVFGNHDEDIVNRGFAGRTVTLSVGHVDGKVADFAEHNVVEAFCERVKHGERVCVAVNERAGQLVTTGLEDDAGSRFICTGNKSCVAVLGILLHIGDVELGVFPFTCSEAELGSISFDGFGDDLSVDTGIVSEVAAQNFGRGRGEFAVQVARFCIGEAGLHDLAYLLIYEVSAVLGEMAVGVLIDKLFILVGKEDVGHIDESGICLGKSLADILIAVPVSRLVGIFGQTLGINRNRVGDQHINKRSGVRAALLLEVRLVSSRLQNKFEKYSKIPMPNGMTGKDVAEKMLHDNGIYDVKVISTPGHLTDHYNPVNQTVNLSESVYYSNSIAAAAVAAHECGHAVQHATAYAPLRMRSALVPVVSFASNIMTWVLLGGMLLINTFPQLMLFGIILFASTTLFSFITLPVEINASQRALVWLSNAGITNVYTHDKAEDALRSAAYTYVVAALGSLATLLYYIMIFLGGRSRD